MPLKKIISILGRLSLQTITLLFLLIFSINVFAQLGTNGLTGTIRDTTGAVVGGAIIIITNKNIGETREIVSNENGTFIIEKLQPSVYKVTVTAAGFADVTIDDLQIRVGEVATLKVNLKPEAASEVVEIKANEARGVDTTSIGQSAFISDRYLIDLPLNGRNFLELAFLLPGNAPTPNFDLTKTNTLEVSSLGGLGRGGNVSVDGADNNDEFVGGVLQNFPQDSISEFQIITTLPSADVGRTGTSAVNIVTKTGTNDLHGLAGFFFRNDRLSGLPATLDRTLVKQLGRPPFDREQYTGTIGGPIKRDKAWFFSAFEYRKQDGILLTTSRDTVGQQLLNSYSDAALRDLLYTLRADWQVNEKDRLTFRYAFQNADDVSLGQGLAATSTGNQRQMSSNRYNSFVFNSVHIFSPKLINDFVFQYNRYRNRIPTFFNGPDIEFPSVSDGGSVFSPQTTKQNKTQLRDSVSYTTTNHSFKFGAEYQRINNFENFQFLGVGAVVLAEDFPSQERNNDGVLNDLDIPVLFSIKSTISQPDIDYSNDYLAFYLQDNWKVKPNFTVSLGLRYEFETNSNNQDYFSKLNSLQLPFVDPAGRRRDLDNFGPRIGFNWDLFKNGNTSLHGGFGLYYDRIVVNIRDLEQRMNGVILNPIVRDGSQVDDNGFFLPGTPTLANPFIGQPMPADITGLNVLDGHLEQPVVQQYAIGIRQKLPFDMVLSVDGVHAFGSKFILSRPAGIVNNPASGPQQVFNIESAGKSWYDGLLVSVEKRASHNFQFIASYTLSKALNYSDDDQLNGTFPVVDANNLRGEKGYAPNDQRHRFTFAAVVNAPFGIDISPILTVGSSVPFNVLYVDPNLGSTRIPFAMRNSAARQFHNGKELNAFINQINAGGGIPDFGPLPFVRDDLKLGKSFASLDLRISKIIKITERFNVQGIAEVFNLFNRTNIRSSSNFNFAGFQNVLVRDSEDPSDPGYLRSSSFGSKVQTAGGVFGTGGPRAFQFAVKLNF